MLTKPETRAELAFYPGWSGRSAHALLEAIDSQLGPLLFIQHSDHGCGFYHCMVRELPKDFLVAIDLESVSPLALLATEEIPDDKVAVMQYLQACDPGEIQIGYVLSGEFPDNLADRG